MSYRPARLLVQPLVRQLPRSHLSRLLAPTPSCSPNPPSRIAHRTCPSPPVGPPPNEAKSFEAQFSSLVPSFGPEEFHEVRPSSTLDNAPSRQNKEARRFARPTSFASEPLPRISSRDRSWPLLRDNDLRTHCSIFQRAWHRDSSFPADCRVRVSGSDDGCDTPLHRLLYMDYWLPASRYCRGQSSAGVSPMADQVGWLLNQAVSQGGQRRNIGKWKHRIDTNHEKYMMPFSLSAVRYMEFLSPHQHRPPLAPRCPPQIPRHRQSPTTRYRSSSAGVDVIITTAGNSTTLILVRGASLSVDLVLAGL
ncbi:hypothetical protein B0T16DRAFT_12695 [Cercophora newfieldiana]|uniref:Uncharacterized protein n=1 Tax=Cercophora newfieldiana TaxID=92897 RepID=A0AA39YN19_9PEZI|nr:hypothetical protein B0T16DRAFT_12695 [Cercophora newfieldiana]